MKISRMFAVLFSILPFLIFPAITHAVAINVQINGAGPSTPCADGSPTCNIAGTYGNVQVVNDGGTAKVEAIEGSLPLLRLINAKFIALANGASGSVTFSRQYSSGRTNAKMQRVANGQLGRGSAAPYAAPPSNHQIHGDFTVDGVVTSSSLSPNAESIDGLQQGGNLGGSAKHTLCSPLSCGTINPGVSPWTKTETMTQLTGARNLKGEFTFYLPLASDFLKITEVTVATQDPGVVNEESVPLGETDIVAEDEQDEDEDGGGKGKGKCCCLGKKMNNKHHPDSKDPDSKDIQQSKP